MIVLGIDPGLSLTGWGIIASDGKNALSLIGYGCIKTGSNLQLCERLKIINHTIRELVRLNKPEVMAIEELFFAKEAKTVASVGQARGAILLAAVDENLPVHEYNPRKVKIALTGYGAADKNQIQHMVQKLLGLKEIPKPDDAADALAIAMCHLNTNRYNVMIGTAI
ncbi:MAG: crossover junction endodeoxyribonuclease RuvC [Elusimicrobiota bacterium]